MGKELRAACNSCRKRRVKCDRANPCSTCTSHNTPCITSHEGVRARGRQGGRRSNETAALQSRLASLEALVNAIATREDVSVQQLPTPGSLPEVAPSPAELGQRGLTRQHLGPAWSQLSEQIERIRDLLLSSSDEDEEVSVASPTTIKQPSYFNFIVGPSSSLQVNDIRALEHPSIEIRAALFAVYCKNIHPVVKAVHHPTLRRQMNHACDHAQPSITQAANNAMLFAVYAISINSMTDAEWSMLAQEPRLSILQRCIFAAEYFLHKADFLSSGDIAILQAFLLYLLVVRVQDATQRHWALVGLAVQLARGQGLDSAKAVNSFGFEQRELRLCLWNSLRSLDFRSVFDRGSEPIIQLGSFDTPAPSNLDDEEICQNLFVAARTGVTEGSISILYHEGVNLLTQLYKLDTTHIGADTAIWTRRLQLVDVFELDIAERFGQPGSFDPGQYQILQNIFCAFCRIGRLLALRPFVKKGGHLPTTPRGHSYNVLSHAIEALKAEQAFFEQSTWRGLWWNTWVHWYPLTVALVEICGDPSIVKSEDMWQILEICYERQSHQIADTAAGKLWKPVTKLMRRVRSIRAHLSQNNTGTISQHEQGYFDQVYDPITMAPDWFQGHMRTMSYIDGPNLPVGDSGPVPGYSPHDASFYWDQFLDDVSAFNPNDFWMDSMGA